MNRIELLQSVLRSSLHLKKGERFAVITDTNKLDIGRDFHCAAEALGAHSTAGLHRVYAGVRGRASSDRL